MASVPIGHPSHDSQCPCRSEELILLLVGQHLFALVQKSTWKRYMGSFLLLQLLKHVLLISIGYFMTSEVIEFLINGLRLRLSGASIPLHWHPTPYSYSSLVLVILFLWYFPFLFRDWFKTVSNTLVFSFLAFHSKRHIKVQRVQPYNNTDKATAWKNFCFLSDIRYPNGV